MPGTSRGTALVSAVSAVSARFRYHVAQTVAGIPLPVAIIYLLSTAFNLLAYAQADITHTVGSSYAYLLGHPLDFYDYDKAFFVGNDYLPTVYVIFAIWMAPVKLLTSPGVQAGLGISPFEVVWAKLLLLLAFWIAFYVVSLIAKELFPDRPQAQTTAKVAFILSPIAGFALNVFGQYDIFGLLFVLLGFLFYLRGDKWKFALFFGLGLTSKYFAVVVFLPLLVLRYKRFREMIPVGLVAAIPLAIEVAVYLPNAAFRNYTLFGHAGSLAGSATTQPITIFIGIIYAAGVVLLWRLRPKPGQLGPIAVYAALMGYSLMLAAITWNPQWFIVITPFAALAAGYLRRRTLFLVWDSVFFVFFIWLVVQLYPANVDSTMVNLGGLRDVLGHPHLLLENVYPHHGVKYLQILVLVYLLSPAIFALFERLVGSSPVGDPKVPTGVWILRSLVIPLAWTLPVIVTLVVPLSVAVKVQPLAPTFSMGYQVHCSQVGVVNGPLTAGSTAEVSFVSGENWMNAISAILATYGSTPSGTIYMTLTDESGRTVAKESENLKYVGDNSPAAFVFPTVENTGGKRYTATFTVSPDASPVALRGGPASCERSSESRIDGKLIASDIAIIEYAHE